MNFSVTRAPRRVLSYLARSLKYAFQRGTGWGIDRAVIDQLSAANRGFHGRDVPREEVARLLLASFDFSDRSRYRVVRDDIYRRFEASEHGGDVDRFGRRGQWIPRGCIIYYDLCDDLFVKVFDDHFCRAGEGRFLPEALDRGVYDFLCPALEHVLVDTDGHLRGYAIRSGRVLSRYEFERYVGDILNPVVCEVTTRTGFYFYDLTYHNVILREGRLSFIDLESVLPLSWYGKGLDFAESMLNDIDIGYALQSKFNSPAWYASHVEALNGPV